MEITSKFKNMTVALLAGATLGAAALGINTTKASADEVHTEYTVQKGDTLSEISMKFGITDYMKVAQYNHIANPNALEVGQKLVVTDATNLPVETTNTNTATSNAATTSNAPKTQVATPKATTYNEPKAQVATPKATTSNTPVAKSSTGYTGGSSANAVANEMASRTGVPASEWAMIIQRESGGNANVSNASSGAYGLFQLLGHGEHAGMSVSEQMDMATSVYNAQGLSAWAQTR